MGLFPLFSCVKLRLTNMELGDGENEGDKTQITVLLQGYANYHTCHNIIQKKRLDSFETIITLITSWWRGKRKTNKQTGDDSHAGDLGKIHALQKVGNESYKDAGICYINRVNRGTLGYASKVRDALLHRTFSATKEEAGSIEAARPLGPKVPADLCWSSRQWKNHSTDPWSPPEHGHAICTKHYAPFEK